MTAPDLPKYCYLRGNKIWVRYKDEHGKWKNIPCGKPAYELHQVELARRFVTALLRGVERKRERGESEPNTVAEYIAKWLAERESRGLACVDDDRRRLKYALPHVGHIQLEQLRPRHVRDMIRALRKMAKESPTGTPAPRTIHHIYNALHTVMRSAIVEELYFGENPVIADAGEMPAKLDADREWRSQATFSTSEIVKLISDPIIPVERRVQYALKALTGMRHGEVAAICWRHRDKQGDPLPRLNVVQAWSTPKKEVKDCKDGEKKAVPEHAVLTQILDAWHDVHWERIYGRKPGPGDYIVPTRTMNCVDGADANDAFKRDLAAIGLRVEASTPGPGRRKRDRGGHDLRAWFETQTVEDGADSGIIWRLTHAAPKTVKGGYERFSYKALCRELSKLEIKLDRAPLTLGTHSLQYESKVRGRWQNSVTPKGLEREISGSGGTWRAPALVDNNQTARASMSNREHSVVTRPLREGTRVVRTAARLLEQAIRDGDLPRALELTAQLASLG